METHINTYKLTQGDKQYILTISTVGDNIRITCKNALNGNITKFSKDFSLQELRKADKVFNAASSSYEALDYIDRALKIQKVGVSEEGDIIKVNFYLTPQNTGYNLEIPLGNTVQNTTTTTTTTFDINQVVGSTQNNVEQYLSGLNTGYTVDGSTDILQNIQNIDLSDNTTSGQYVTGFEDISSQYITGNEDLTAQYTTGVEDFTNQYTTTQDYTTQNTTGEFQDLNQYTGIVTDNTTQYTNFFDSTPYITPTTDYNSQNLNTFEIKTQKVETTKQYVEPTQIYESKPYIEPVEDLVTVRKVDNKNTYEKTITTATKTDINTKNIEDDKINRLVGDTNSLKNDYQFIQDKLKVLEGQVNSYKTQIKLMEREKASNEVSQLLEENKIIKQQLSELEKMRNDAAEVRVLRSQLVQLAPLRKKAAQVEVLKAQLNELNTLKAKAVELNTVKQQLEELNKLRAQVAEMNIIKQQLGELNSLRSKVAELNNVKLKLGELNNLRAQVGQINILKQQLKELNSLKNNAIDIEMLKRKITELESIKLQYEKEIRSLRESQNQTTTMEQTKLSELKQRNIGMDSKQLLFEDRSQQICVKGDIIHNTDELELLTRKMNKLNQKITLNLLYKATADSDKASVFHAKCDEARSTLVLVETDKGMRFGGYTTCSWAGDCIDKKDEEAFIFSLDKMKVYENIPEEDAVGCYPKFGPIFLGCQIRIYDDAFTKGGTTFEKGLNYNTEEDYELTGGERTFNIREIEVYEVIAQ